MEGVFFFLFGVAVGIGLFPHLQNLTAQVRRRLAQLDQPDQPERPKGPSPWS
jgi:hypothetical protein